MINPYKNRESTARNIASAERLARYAATIFTSIGAFVYGRDLSLKYLPEGWCWSPWIAVAGGVFIAGAAAWLTDMMFGTLLQRVTYDTLASRHPNVTKWQGAVYFKNLRTAESWMIGILLAALLGFDLYTTLIIRDPVAEQARQTPLVDVVALRGNLEAAEAASIAQLRDDAKQKEKSIRETEKRVEAGNPALARLKASGNAWASTKIAKSQAKATAPDQKGRAALETAIASRVAEGPAYIQARVAEAEAANARALDSNTRNRDVMAGMYTAFTVVPKALAILLRILMVVTFLAYSSKFNPDLTGDGIIDYQDVQEYFERQKQAALDREQQYQAARRQNNPPAGSNPAFP